MSSQVQARPKRGQGDPVRLHSWTRCFKLRSSHLGLYRSAAHLVYEGGVIYFQEGNPCSQGPSRRFARKPLSPGMIKAQSSPRPRLPNIYIASPRSTTHIYQTRIATLHIWSSSIHMFPPAPLHTLFSFDFPGIIRCIVSFGSFLSLLLKS